MTKGWIDGQCKIYLNATIKNKNAKDPDHELGI
jgi:hypothetical protein